MPGKNWLATYRELSVEDVKEVKASNSSRCSQFANTGSTRTHGLILLPRREKGTLKLLRHFQFSGQADFIMWNLKM